MFKPNSIFMACFKRSRLQSEAIELLIESRSHKVSRDWLTHCQFGSFHRICVRHLKMTEHTSLNLFVHALNLNAMCVCRLQQHSWRILTISSVFTGLCSESNRTLYRWANRGGADTGGHSEQPEWQRWGRTGRLWLNEGCESEMNWVLNTSQLKSEVKKCLSVILFCRTNQP